MTGVPPRTKKARRSGGTCPSCRTPIIGGQQITQQPTGWTHTRCVITDRPTEGDPMAAGDTQITICGNLVEDPNLRFTPSGQAVATFRIASTPRYYDKQANEWKDGDSLFLTCNVWRQPAENVAESLQRGMRVIVQGRLKQRSYEKDGQKRIVYEVEVDEIGPSLRNATAKVHKAQRDRPGQQGGGFGQPSQPNQSQPADPWANQGAQPPF